MIKLEDFDFDNIWIDQKSHENILIYDGSFKTFIGPKSLWIRFDKIDEFIRIYDVSKYLVLLGSEKYVIYNRIRYLISLKSVIADVPYYAKTKVDSYDSLPIKKADFA